MATSGLDVFAHNMETVERLQGVVRDRRANWKQSLAVLRHAKEVGFSYVDVQEGQEGQARKKKGVLTKTSLMLGLGETREEVVDALRVLRAHSVDVVTLGQYVHAPCHSLLPSLTTTPPNGTVSLFR